MIEFLNIKWIYVSLIPLRQRHRLPVTLHFHAIQKAHAEQWHIQAGFDDQAVDLIQRDASNFNCVEHHTPCGYYSRSGADAAGLRGFVV